MSGDAIRQTETMHVQTVQAQLKIGTLCLYWHDATIKSLGVNSRHMTQCWLIAASKASL